MLSRGYKNTPEFPREQAKVPLSRRLIFRRSVRGSRAKADTHASPKTTGHTYIFANAARDLSGNLFPKENVQRCYLSTRLFAAKLRPADSVCIAATGVILLTSKNRFPGVKARYPRDNSRILAAADFSRARLTARRERPKGRVSRKPAGQCNFIHFLLARSGL